MSSFRVVNDLLSLVNVLATSVAVIAVLATTVPEVIFVVLVVAVPFAWAARFPPSWPSGCSTR